MEWLSENGAALHCVSERLQADREVVMAAVSSNGFALEYASKDRAVRLQ